MYNFSAKAMIRSKNQKYLLRNRVSECDCISFEFTNVEERLTNAEKCPIEGNNQNIMVMKILIFLESMQKNVIACNLSIILISFCH